jgi:uncharacterized protein (TIGR02147 family)
VISVYEHSDYKNFLKARSGALGQRSGFKSGLARACGCNNAYVSSVFADGANLSLEQAERACPYLQLDPDESHYFLLLVQKARAGTVSLASYFERLVGEMRERKLNVQGRLGARERLSQAQQARYYSSWIYSALHVALSVPRLARSVETLAAYFDLTLPAVNEALEFLLETGLARRSPNGGFEIGNKHIHLGKNSENIQRHHGNWRLQSLRAFERRSERALHYSSVVTLSREDAERVREILLKSIKSTADVILSSPEEEVFVLDLDFFPLGKTV